MISIVIPNYNKQDYILETLKSINNQSFQKWECIIVDDNSTDKSVKIINSFIKDKNRFSLVYKESNTGASSCRNLGLKRSNGDYIIFLDSDDILCQYCLKSRYNLINNTKLDFAVFPIGTFYSRVSDNDYIWNNFSGNHLKRFLSHDLPWAICSVIWKKSTLDRLEGFDESYVRLQDVELHSRALLLKNIKYITFDKLVSDCFYRIDSNRIKNYTNFLKKDILGKTNYYNYFKTNLKGSKNLKNLKGTIFESYLIIYTFYKQDKITTTQLINLINLLENSFDISNWSQFNKLWILIYKIIKKRKIHFKGLNFIFKLFLIK